MNTEVNKILKHAIFNVQQITSEAFEIGRLLEKEASKYKEFSLIDAIGTNENDFANAFY